MNSTTVIFSSTIHSDGSFSVNGEIPGKPFILDREALPLFNRFEDQIRDLPSYMSVDIADKSFLLILARNGHFKNYYPCPMGGK
jgi:hypothetical protein